VIAGHLLASLAGDLQNPQPDCAKDLKQVPLLSTWFAVKNLNTGVRAGHRVIRVSKNPGG
jgi:hypothetical protein